MNRHTHLFIVGISFYTVSLRMTARFDFELCRFSFYGNVKFLKFPQKCILKAHCGFLLVEEASENLKNFLKHLAKWAFSDSRSERNTQKSPEM